MKETKGKAKPKTTKVNLGQLVVLAAYEKTFSSGKKGFFGKVLDPATGQRYQVIGAVKGIFFFF